MSTAEVKKPIFCGGSLRRQSQPQQTRRIPRTPHLFRILPLNLINHLHPEPEGYVQSSLSHGHIRSHLGIVALLQSRRIDETLARKEFHIFNIAILVSIEFHQSEIVRIGRQESNVL